MLYLTQEEQRWLDAYRQILDDQFSGLVEEFLIFGSKARGDSSADSDLDLLLVIKEGDWRRKEEITGRETCWPSARRWCLPLSSTRGKNGSSAARTEPLSGKP